MSDEPDKTEGMNVIAWHFVGDTLRDGSPVPPDGETLIWPGDLKICASGYHASERIIDALVYAPGNTICRVSCGGEMIRQHDKFVCRERTILWRIDGESLLREFARKQVLSAKHLWDMPVTVQRCLETGDESLRGAARVAARVAAGDAAWAAAGDAAWAVARVAARVAAGDAVGAVARVAAGDAARVAAWAAAWDAANDMLTEMVNAGRKEDAMNEAAQETPNG